MEKVIYPRENKEASTVSELLPRLKRDAVDKNLDLLKISSLVDGTKITGSGVVRNHVYRWKMAVESSVMSIGQVPDRFFDVKGRSYPIDWNRKVSVASLPTYENYKDAIIYRINSNTPVITPAAKIIFDSNAPTTGQGTYHLAYFSDKPDKITLGYLLQNAQGAKTEVHREDIVATLTKTENSKLSIALSEGNKIAEVSVADGSEKIVLITDLNKGEGTFSLVQRAPLPVSPSITNEIIITVYNEDNPSATGTINLFVAGNAAKGLYTQSVENIGDSATYSTYVSYEEIIDYAPISGADGNGFTVYDNDFFKIYRSSMYGYDWYYSLLPVDTLISGTFNASKQIYEFKVDLPYYSINSNIMAQSSQHFTVYDGGSAAATLVTYMQNKSTTSLYAANDSVLVDQYGALNNINTHLDIEDGDYLAIIVDLNNEYHALIGKNEHVTRDSDVIIAAQENVQQHTQRDEFAKDTVVWSKPTVPVDVTQFIGLDMWIRFHSINEMIYFMITKYAQDIESIVPSTIYSTDINSSKNASGETQDHKIAVNCEITTVEENEDAESRKKEGKLWAYVNPRTMTPFPDDYWFHRGEPVYVKSLTIAPRDKKIKGNRITVKADQWPGMYMVVGETYIRNRDTGEDERMQLKFPMCKVRSDQTITLSADGEPTTFNLNLEVARPKNGIMMEITTYEVAKKLIEGEDGCFFEADGSTEVLSE